ncbi:DUF2577 family protein [Paenibacillus planticolens]|uniref:DUF2577 domain-containing protein n=1 Tax=Paenibacillus planticolens TaxID=2654976 RepID=A0ABX1ZHG4_9BACL|nr:DUF2577 family protein [Paenibacillus planticolens]NOU98489.1 DUF2577 domain-containing protein [Paenibacillus planticolens]
MGKEGTGASQLAQVIRSLGYNDFDRFEFATVTSLIPTKIRVDGMKIELDAYDIVMAEHLTDHTRDVTINGGVLSTMVVKSPLTVGSRVIVASMSDGQKYVVLDKAVMI